LAGAAGSLRQGEQGFLDPVAQTVAHARALGFACFTPLLPDARGATRLRCTAAVQQAPHVGELGVALAAQQIGQVEFQVGGTGERGRIAQQTQLLAVADDTQVRSGLALSSSCMAWKADFCGCHRLHRKARVGVVQSQVVGPPAPPYVLPSR
jgi:hypothetical protein